MRDYYVVPNSAGARAYCNNTYGPAGLIKQLSNQNPVGLGRRGSIPDLNIWFYKLFAGAAPSGSQLTVLHNEMCAQEKGPQGPYSTAYRAARPGY